MWSGPMSCAQPPSSVLPVIVSTLEPMPRMSAPIFTSMRARSWTCGSQAALPITVSPGVSAAAISAFSVAITDGSSMKTSAARRPPTGASMTMSRSCRKLAPSAAKRVEVRIEAPAADHVAAGRRHHRAAEAREQRAGEQERGADRLGAAAVDLRVRVDVGGAQADLVLAEPVDRDAEALEHREHRLDVADPRDVADDDLLARSAPRRRGSAARRSCSRQARSCRSAACRPR